jgi:hypothetical protein
MRDADGLLKQADITKQRGRDGHYVYQTEAA